MKEINKDTFLNSFNKGIKLDKAFYFRIYGYEISYPGFKEKAIEKLKELGFIHADSDYERVINAYEAEQSKQLKDIAKEYVKEINKEFRKRKVIKY